MFSVNYFIAEKEKSAIQKSRSGTFQIGGQSGLHPTGEVGAVQKETPRTEIQQFRTA
jgi:hypothetical protein